MQAKKIAILASHPIQYYAPVFRLLAQEPSIYLKVFYSLGEQTQILDSGFGKKIEWDIPLLEGYAYQFLENTSPEKGSHHFKGIDNPRVLTEIENFNPHVLLVYGWSYKSHLKTIRYFKNKIPLWFRGDSTLYDNHSLWKTMLKRISLRWVYKNIDTAFYVGSANKKYFKFYGLKEHQLVFAPHAIDNQRFSSKQNEESAALRRSLGLQDEDILVLFCGKLEAKKDPMGLLKAFLNVDNIKTHLLFVGNGPLENELKTLAAAKKTNRIHFIDFVNQSKIPAVYQSCDLFCLPSVGPSETWGLAVNEAMAASKPILVSEKVGCAVDLVKNGENGYIFNPKNEIDLFNKLVMLCNSKTMLQEMGAISFQKIQNWTFEKQIDAFKRALN
ncbi:glycosyltransferase family 4 protein [Pedobacter sp. MW01-1-1]|uniref:glycosyltransferase family 4 protein n=1 Tax=Pedobacter sp. MW01-1-1 TaxID=3383027 RepID=UPI003FEE1278